MSAWDKLVTILMEDTIEIFGFLAFCAFKLLMLCVYAVIFLGPAVLTLMMTHSIVGPEVFADERSIAPIVWMVLTIVFWVLYHYIIGLYARVTDTSPEPIDRVFKFSERIGNEIEVRTTLAKHMIEEPWKDDK